jgi:hypothetical protein
MSYTISDGAAAVSDAISGTSGLVGNFKGNYAYPSNCGDKDYPSWIQFSVRSRKGITSDAIITNIALYMPENASVPSTASWENAETSAMINSIRNAQIKRIESGEINAAKSRDAGFALEAMTGEMGTANSGGLGHALRQFADKGNLLPVSVQQVAGAMATQAAANTVGGALSRSLGRTNSGGNLSTDQSLGALFGATRNPYLTALFRGIDFRTFEFTFNLFPHNQEEAETIDAIIKVFRQAYLPSYGSGVGGKAILDYPLEFNISYKWGTKDNPYLNKFMNCVLVGLEVNHTGYGSWVSMKNGFPASTIIQLRFSETNIVTREDVARGY